MPRKRAVAGRLFQRKGRPGFYLRLRSDGREVTRFAGSDRKTATARLARVVREYERSVLLGEKPIRDVTFAELKPALVAHLKARHDPTTVAVEAQRLERITEYFGTEPICHIASAMVEDFLTWLKVEHKVGTATCNRYLALLSVAFRFAVDRGMARSNPTSSVRRPREETRPVPYISSEDGDRIVGAAADLEYATFLRLLNDAGLRRSEGLRLTWRDVDLTREQINVRRSKTHRPRVVPLSNAAADALVALRGARPVIPMTGKDPLWPTLTKLAPSSVTSRFRAVVRRAGLPHLRLHDLRHGFCSRLAQAGVPLATIGALAGHESFQTTARYACHIPAGAERAAIAVLNRKPAEDAPGTPKGTVRGTEQKASA